MKKINHILLFLTTFLLTILFIPSREVQASNILLQDDFNSISGLWTQFSPWGSWTINAEGNYVGVVTLFSQPERQTYAIAGDTNWKDYSFSVSIKGIRGAGKYILFRINESGNAYLLNLRAPYRAGGTNYPSAVFLGKRTPVGSPNSSIIASVLNYPIQNNTWYNVRVEVKDNDDLSTAIKVYIDENLVIDFTDSNPIPNGKIGLEVWPGGYADPAIGQVTETYYDNVVVKDLQPNSGLFELPFDYPGRSNGDPDDFNVVFHDRVRSYFDHEFARDSFVLYNGQTSLGNCDPSESPSAEECYDSHNAMDFTSTKGESVLSAASGNVVFASDNIIEINPETQEEEVSCETHKSGLGCIVIIEHGENIYTLYAHLKRVDVEEGDLVNKESILGAMGNTGCFNKSTGRGCKAHLHFGVMAPKNQIAAHIQIMTEGDWDSLLSKMSSEELSKEKKKPYMHYQPFCSITAGNGLAFVFKDPNGWSGEGVDPWSKPISEGGCGIESEYLWKYPL